MRGMLVSVFVCLCLVLSSVEAGQLGRRGTADGRVIVVSNRLDQVSSLGSPSLVATSDISYAESLEEAALADSERVCTVESLDMETLDYIAALSYLSLVDPAFLFECQSALYEQSLDDPSLVGLDEISMYFNLVPIESYSSAALVGLNALERQVILSCSPVSRIDSHCASRFDIFAPVEGSRLWSFKRRALRMEQRGENTDALYSLCWELMLLGILDTLR